MRNRSVSTSPRPRIAGKQTSPIGPEQYTTSETYEYTVLFEDDHGQAMTAPTSDRRAARRQLGVTRGQVDAGAQIAISTVTIQRSAWTVTR